MAHSACALPGMNGAIQRAIQARYSQQVLSTLPARLAEVVGKMKPGEVSAPVPFESSVLLLLLESIDDPGAAQARRRERVRSAIALDLSQTATESFLRDLRGKSRVVVHEKLLPFHYVADTPGTS